MEPISEEAVDKTSDLIHVPGVVFNSQGFQLVTAVATMIAIRLILLEALSAASSFNSLILNPIITI